MPLNLGLTFWSEGVYSEHPAHTYGYYAGIYALFQICALISLLLFIIAITIFSVKRAGANLHRDALRTMIRAPLGFFTATDTGVVTNLFSQDLNLIDTELPFGLLNTLLCVSLLFFSIRVCNDFVTLLCRASARNPFSLTVTPRFLKQLDKRV